MPKLGEIKTLKELGYKGYPTNKCIWSACIDCGKERWVLFIKGKPSSLRCNSCGHKVHPHIMKGPNNPNWKGGRKANRADYNSVRLYEDDFFYPMANKDGYVAEHRLVMAKHLKRCLLPLEVVHHKNAIKKDNRLENLQLFPANKQHAKQHLPDPLLRRRVKRLEQDVVTCLSRITLLEAENALLREQITSIKELPEATPGSS